MILATRKVCRGSTVVEVGLSPGNVVRISGVFRETGEEPWLQDLLVSVHEEAQRVRLDELVLDLRSLTYANAEGWRNLVLLLRLLKGPPRASYKLLMLTNMTHQWQRVGIPTLSVFGGSMLNIDSRNTSPESDVADSGRRSWKA